jgi:hypothetical protein
MDQIVEGGMHSPSAASTVIQLKFLYCRIRLAVQAVPYSLRAW